jgi:hypothetical protein
MYFIINSKSKRKPWSKNKSKKVFDLREDCINNSYDLKKNTDKVVELRIISKELNKKITSLKNRRDVILKNLPDDNKLIEDITISTLKDSYNFNEYGFIIRPQFTDLTHCNELKREIQKQEDKKFKLDDLLKELEINLIQDKIDKLLGLLEDEYEI